ncbi:hypothetical protein HHK36_013821 [Tetracentron sinense]|uniref:DNA-3-methyladenine glycosylase I n=1 Tax=Tetracentron sinense TaxID=13715 RepID=A0A834ZE10_TETSI|nr:hypothetical protein HHK36_013821 [Tetracentron sinense]
MSGGPRVRSMNVADSEVRPVLGPAGNKARSLGTQKPASKPLRKVEKMAEVAAEEKKAPPSPVAASSPPLHSVSIPTILRRQEQLLQSNLSLNASCSSDASSDSFHSRASTGKISRTSSTASRRKQYASKSEKVVPDSVSASPPDTSQAKKKCSWVTPNTGKLGHELTDVLLAQNFVRFEILWPRKLFELLILSGALAELTWPVILSKRHIFREVFADFDPVSVSKLNEKKLTTPGSTASSLLSELKLRAIIENGRQISKIIDEFGSFDKYIWSFVNYKPLVSRFRYPRQVPVKTPKADVISKDLVRRGFRSVGPTVIYSFMQVAGITNDHLINCFRFQECIAAAAAGTEEEGIKAKAKAKAEDILDSGLTRIIGELGLSSE